MSPDPVAAEELSGALEEARHASPLARRADVGRADRLLRRIRTELARRSVDNVAGVFGADGLHLSHWPGNRTPSGLKRDLSTSIALEFARLPADERARLTAGSSCRYDFGWPGSLGQ